MIRILLLLPVLLLAGCFGREVKTEVVEVKVPVSVPCIDKVPVRPAYRTGPGEWPGGKSAALIVVSDLEAAKQYGTAWEAAAAGCIKPQPAEPSASSAAAAQSASGSQSKP